MVGLNSPAMIFLGRAHRSYLRPPLVPEQEQAGADHDHRADDETDRRHVAPDRKAEQHRPDQRQILERHHRRGPPGLVTISTPKKPATSATQRAGPIGSFRNTSEASAANSGAEKLIAVALASGIMLKAISSRVCEVNCDMPRNTCAVGRRVRRTARPRLGKAKAEKKMSETNTRLNSTSPTG